MSEGSNLNRSEGSHFSDPPAEVGQPILVLGLGNDLLADDGVGHRVVEWIRRRLAKEWPVECAATIEMGVSLLDWMVGRRRVVLVDAVRTGNHSPGTWFEQKPEEVPAVLVPGPHFFGVGEALKLAHCLEMPIPEEIRIFAVEVEDPWTIGGKMTQAVERAIPELGAYILNLLKGWVKEISCAQEGRSKDVTT